MTLPAVTALSEALDALREVPLRAPQAGSSAVLEWSRLAVELRRVAEAHVAASAGEIARRSAPELGREGLARQAGARTVEELLTTAGMTGREAAAAVRVGRITQGDSEVLSGVGERVLDGTVSVAAAEAIRVGLEGAGAPVEIVSRAAELLCDDPAAADPDRLLKRAREVRDELDEAGIADREQALRARRSLRRIDCRDGMKRLVWDYDPETAGIVDEIYDRLTSPRRGGPRFVDAEQAARADRVASDPRTTQQLASDGFAELLRQSASIDENVLLGSGIPSVRVIVAAEALEAGTGHGVIEGSDEAVSLATVQRLACSHGVQPVVLTATGRPLDVGREQRLFTARQRIALALRDGGCLWTGCDRPPSWCEAHHIDDWAAGGRTDIDRGVLLCRHHHLKLHNERWRIRLRADQYWLEPPPGSGRLGALLVTKSRALREHLTRAAGMSH
jgi:hypothetical protein